MKPLVRYASLSSYAELCRSLNIDPRALMRSMGLDISGLAVQDRWAPGAAVVRLLERSAEVSGREDFGLRLAERRRFSNLGPIGLVAREEPTARSALELLIRYERMYNEALHTRLAEAEGLATLKMDLDLGEPLPCRQSTELAVGAYHHVLRHFLGDRWQPLAVCFTHQPPADLAAHRRFFGPAVEFDREFNGILCYSGDLDTANPEPDPQLRSYARQYFDSVAVSRDTSVQDRVVAVIEVLLPTGRCSIEQVAHSLSVDRRTVHRHLAESGESFSSLLNAVRARLAEQFVANPRRSFTEISDLLGFSAPSAFSRWFRERFGCSPREWRSRSRMGK
ncbi:AraC family transcriptional regulator [Streptomyces sp. NBC_00963]|uniref:AraC family transcriptional regulator ligand-binding domain-containing protein n=1 Tax=unclassified Streptomyces TaxID=2593676 RepID=UPI00224EBC53|nr:AraC family transcriptional regulator ligand-binding domain-containing protein [Streptomyces sp. NBC_01306]MCX4726697.1 AraC family transcriptional regulator [Streptomyces sp. NBC_01306]WSX42061.1 AraC family transcriptional regulator [Streptomyces sp. NBC_00963]